MAATGVLTGSQLCPTATATPKLSLTEPDSAWLTLPGLHCCDVLQPSFSSLYIGSMLRSTYAWVRTSVVRKACDAPVTVIAAPAVAEGFEQRCAALARLTTLPPVAATAVQKLSDTHRKQLRALLVRGPIVTDVLNTPAASGDGPTLTNAEEEPASSLDWQIKAAAKRSRAADASLQAGARSPASASLLARSQIAVNTHPASASDVGGALQAAGNGASAGNTTNNLEVSILCGVSCVKREAYLNDGVPSPLVMPRQRLL